MTAPVPPVATVEGDHAFIKIRINGKLHLSFIRDELLSVQSWHVDGSLWQIEYVSKSGVRVRTDYTKRELWEQILEGLDRIAVALE